MKEQTFPTPAIYGPYDVAVAENKRLMSELAACRARNARLEEALTKALVIIQGATYPGMPESPFMRDARAILAEETK